MNTANFDSTDIKVSVAMITYNHEAFIAQAIESVLIQQTNFAVELVIGEDCSTDNTRTIVRDFAERYPDHIRLLLPEHNLGMLPNFVATLKACRGQYVALLEGDDYWTDPFKLQKQVEFLEGHPEYVLCHHDAVITDECGNRIKNSKLPDYAKHDFSADELVKGAWVLTLTACFRNVIRKYPPESLRVLNGDTFLFSLLGNFGKSKFQGDVIAPAVYRVHAGSVWSSEVSLRKRLFSQLVTCHWLRRYYVRVGKTEYAQHFSNRLPLARVLYNLEQPKALEEELAGQLQLLEKYLEVLNDTNDEVEVIRKSLLANLYMGAAFVGFSWRDSESGSVFLSKAITLDPSVWGDETTLEQALINQGIAIAESRGDFDATRLLSYIEGIGHRPSRGTQFSKGLVRKVQGRLFAESAYRCHLAADHSGIRLFTGLAFRTDPSLLKDVGMLRRSLQLGSRATSSAAQILEPEEVG